MGSLTVVDYFLISLLSVLPALVGFFSLIFIQIFSSPLDYFNGVFSKVIVWMGMTLSFGVLLILPFDIWALDGGLYAATPYIWQIVFAAIALFIVVIIPFAFWYYEGHDTERNFVKGIICQAIYGFVAAFICFAVACIAIVISYIWLGFAEIPVEVQSTGVIANTYDGAYFNILSSSLVNDDIIDVRMSFVVYLAGILAIAGWVVFVVFGGCGMSALPVELIFQFIKRPKALSEQDFILAQKMFASRAEKLIKLGKTLNESRKTVSGRLGRSSISKYQRFKKAVYQCEDDYKKVEIAFKEGGGNPFIYFGSLIVGIVSILIAILWVVHMIIYMVPPKPLWPFLNFFFIYLDYGFPLFGLIAYMIFTYYLLFAVLAGNVCIMSRIPLVSVFPLKVKNTSTTSFLYNSSIMLLASITIVQFSCQAFRDYINYTSIDGFFNVIVGNMRGLKYFYNYVFYAFFAMIFIGGLLTLLSLIPGPWNSWHKAPAEKEVDDILRGLEKDIR